MSASFPSTRSPSKRIALYTDWTRIALSLSTRLATRSSRTITALLAVLRRGRVRGGWHCTVILNRPAAASSILLSTHDSLISSELTIGAQQTFENVSPSASTLRRDPGGSRSGFQVDHASELGQRNRTAVNATRGMRNKVCRRRVNIVPQPLTISRFGQITPRIEEDWLEE